MASSSQRRVELDWLRALGMWAVFSYHVLMFVNPFDWHVKNIPTVEGFQYANLIMIPWLMPLFFVISGIGTHYALTRRSGGAFTKERLLRLGVPLLVGIFLLSPPQVYMERLTKGQFTGSLLAFLPHYFDGFYSITPEGNFAWMGLHLWYLLFLLLFALLTWPFARPSAHPGLWERLGTATGPAGLILLPPVLLLVLRLALDPDGAGVGVSGWPILLYLAFYILGHSLFPLESFRAAVRSRGPLLMAGAMLSTLLFLLVNKEVPYGLTAGYLLLSLAWVAASWFSLLAFFDLADRYLTRENGLLRYANQAVMPVYVLHQPAIQFLVGVKAPPGRPVYGSAARARA